jgi:hypothetical protein
MLKDFYIPSLRLSSSTHPKLINDKVLKPITVSLNLKCNLTEQIPPVDYTKSYFTLRKYDQNDPSTGIVFHTFSDMVSKTSVSYNILTFYISFVIVVGRVIRGIIAGAAEKIILTEMPEPGPLINLCEGIKISRYRNDLERELHLYYVLIDFMRSPEILKKLTKSCLKHLREMKKRNNENKEN